MITTITTVALAKCPLHLPSTARSPRRIATLVIFTLLLTLFISTPFVDNGNIISDGRSSAHNDYAARVFAYDDYAAHQLNDNFQALSEENITTLNWVCVENSVFNKNTINGTGIREQWLMGKTKYWLPRRHCQVPVKKIVVYDSLIEMKKNIHGFAVEFRRRKIPYDHYEVKDVAYFHSFSEPFVPENFFHLTKQFLFPLHYIIKNTNRLQSKTNNAVFFHQPWARCPRNGLTIPMKTARYDILFKMLGIHRHGSDLFKTVDYPVRTCYKNVVISQGVFVNGALDAINFFQDKLHVKKDNCPKHILTIINRTVYRRILNIKQLQNIATDMGYYVKTVEMEKLSLAQQAQLIQCTEILVGVTGAGLQWSYFMRNHSGVIEIAWPHCDWPFFFTGGEEYNSGQQDVRPLNFVQLGNTTCKRYIRALDIYVEDLFYTKVKFSAKEKIAIFGDRKNYRFGESNVVSLGKLHDVFVDPIAFKNALVAAKPSYAK